ncbi:MAG: response regulator, partial [Myxococcales bacterium]|nr:response regulator [Myxococcales bacterium]
TRVLDFALGVAALVLGFVVLSLDLQGGPGMVLVWRLLPSLVLVFGALAWRTGPLEPRAWAMVVAYWTGIYASAGLRAYVIPNPFVGALFLCVLAALVFEGRRSWLVVLGTCGVLVVVAAPFIAGREIPPDTFADPSRAANWVRITLIFAAFAAGATGCVRFLVGHLEDALRRGEALYDALEQEALTNLAAQTERHALQSSLQRAARLEALGRLAGGVAHDFNNLLLVMKVNAELAEAAPTEAGRRAALDEIRDAADRAARLTRQLLAFNRNPGPEEAALDVASGVRSTLQMLERVLPGTMELDVHVDPELPRVRGPASSIEQIVMNLVVNARDALRDGGRVSVRAGRAGDFVRVTVSDDGEGMGPEVVAKAMEAGFTTKGRDVGTGLGLALVRTLASMSGGRVELTSVPGEGTTVDVYLGLWTGERPDRTPSDPGAVRGQGETVLVVDDDDAVRRALVGILRTAGYRPLDAPDVQGGLELFRSHRDEVALLITDAILPGRGGRDLADILAAEAPLLPILVCSGYSADLFEPGYFDAPRRGWIGKPLDRQALLAAVSRMLPSPSADPTSQLAEDPA